MSQQPLGSDALHLLRQKYPKLPSDYLQYLSDIGWGQTEGGFMFYSAPVKPSDIFPELAQECAVVLLGDDMMGYCLGVDLQSQCFGEMSDRGAWSPFAPETSLAQFLDRFNTA